MMPSEEHRVQAGARLDSLTKPLESLGRLEEIAAQVVAIRRGAPSLPLAKAVYVFAADHGITAAGVSAYPREVTRQMVMNFLSGGAAINVLARLYGVALTVVDAGVDAELPEHAGLWNGKVARGSANMLNGPAMTEAQLGQAMALGAALATEAATKGYVVVALGEMGIGNTTAASAMTCALTGAAAAQATGRGTGLDDAAHRRKIAVIEQVLARTQPASPLEVLREFGGLEIAAMTGFALAAPEHGIVLVADGFIATAAIAVACAMSAEVQPHVIAGHRSQEPGHALLLARLGLRPLLELDLRLGEGTGAVLAMPMLEAAIALYTEMATFDSAAVSEAGA